MTHEQYLEKLKSLNIKTSILHKCICGTDRKITPNILYI